MPGISFEDFVPSIQKQGFFSREYEPLRGCLERANQWIEDAGVDVVNIETVVLPNIWREDGTEDQEIHTSGDMMSQWHQFIRVWYRGV